jgi:hypothetical protein
MVNTRFHNTLWVPRTSTYYVMGVVLMILGTVSLATALSKTAKRG